MQATARHNSGSKTYKRFNMAWMGCSLETLVAGPGQESVAGGTRCEELKRVVLAWGRRMKRLLKNVLFPLVCTLFHWRTLFGRRYYARGYELHNDGMDEWVRLKDLLRKMDK